MPTTRTAVTHLQRQFDEALKLVEQQDAGAFEGNADRPMAEFLAALHCLVRGRIEDQRQVDMLYRALAYLMAEQPEPFNGTVEEAMDAAIDGAMDSAGPRDQILMALARYRLKQSRLNA